MEQRTSKKPSWKNKRKKSFYTEEGDIGFIFRKPRMQQVVDDTQVPLQNEEESAQKITEEESTKEKDETAQSENFDDSVLEVVEGEEELMKEVELKRFMAQLKKTLLATNADKADKLDTVLEVIAHDLKQPDLYFRFLDTCTSELEKVPPHPLEKELKGSIASLRARMDRFQRELKEWDEINKESCAKLEQAKQSYSSQKHIDFLNLTPENIEALRSYLTSEQLKILEQATTVDSSCVPKVSSQLDDIKTKVDKEFEQIQQKLKTATASIKKAQLDISTVTDTPKTLFRALQNHV